MSDTLSFISLCAIWIIGGVIGYFGWRKLLWKSFRREWTNIDRNFNLAFSLCFGWAMAVMAWLLVLLTMIPFKEKPSSW